MFSWIIILHLKDKRSLAGIRHLDNVWIHEGKQIYLKVASSEQKLDACFRALPAISTNIVEDRLLFREAALTPHSQMPELDWLLLRDALPIEMPIAAMPGKFLAEQQSITPRLERDSTDRNASALEISVQQWNRFILQCPSVRLSRLEVAACEDGRVLLLGEPLPALPGKSFWQMENVLIPMGYALELEILIPVMESSLNPFGDQLLLLNPKGSIELIGKRSFLPALGAKEINEHLPKHE